MMKEIQSGMTFGRYRLERQLATGGMGAVWLARDERLGREVAIKLLPRLLVTDEAAGRRFEREARAMGRLQHPNVISLFDIGTADPGTGEEIPYLVMEFVNGRALDKIIADGPMQPRQAAEIMVQVARALAAAHAAGVVHRDLKPSNIMIADEDHAKVLDFGLARLIKAAGHVPEATLTAPGMVLGSCPYMAPEQALGRGVSETGDLFSLGVVLYEVLCGRRAFTGSTPVQVLQAVIRCDYPKIEDICPSVPSALEAIVERCLEKEPSNRYGNADMVVQDLEAFLQRAESLDVDGPTVEIKTSSIRAVSDRRRRRAIRRAMAGGARTRDRWSGGFPRGSRGDGGASSGAGKLEGPRTSRRGGNLSPDQLEPARYGSHDGSCARG